MTNEKLLEDILSLEDKGRLNRGERDRVRRIIRNVKLRYDRVPKDLAEPLGRVRRTSLITYNLYSRNVGFLFAAVTLFAGIFLSLIWIQNYVEYFSFEEFFALFDELLRLFEVYFFEEVLAWLLGQNFISYVLSYILGLVIWSVAVVLLMTGLSVIVHYLVLKKKYKVKAYFMIHRLRPAWIEDYSDFLQIGFKGRRLSHLTAASTGMALMAIVCVLTTIFFYQYWTVWLIFAFSNLGYFIYIFIYGGEHSDWVRYQKETQLHRRYLECQQPE